MKTILKLSLLVLVVSFYCCDKSEELIEADINENKQNNKFLGSQTTKA